MLPRSSAKGAAPKRNGLRTAKAVHGRKNGAYGPTGPAQREGGERDEEACVGRGPVAAVGSCPRRVPSRTNRVLETLAELEEDGAVGVAALVVAVRLEILLEDLAGAARRPHVERRKLELAEAAVALEVADRVAAPVVDEHGELVRGRRLLLARVRAVVRVRQQQPRAAADLKREEKGRDE